MENANRLIVQQRSHASHRALRVRRGVRSCLPNEKDDAVVGAKEDIVICTRYIYLCLAGNIVTVRHLHHIHTRITFPAGVYVDGNIIPG